MNINIFFDKSKYLKNSLLSICKILSFSTSSSEVKSIYLIKSFRQAVECERVGGRVWERERKKTTGTCPLLQRRPAQDRKSIRSQLLDEKRKLLNLATPPLFYIQQNTVERAHLLGSHGTLLLCTTSVFVEVGCKVRGNIPLRRGKKRTNTNPNNLLRALQPKKHKKQT